MPRNKRRLITASFLFQNKVQLNIHIKEMAKVFHGKRKVRLKITMCGKQLSAARNKEMICKCAYMATFACLLCFKMLNWRYLLKTIMRLSRSFPQVPLSLHRRLPGRLPKEGKTGNEKKQLSCLKPSQIGNQSRSHWLARYH